MKLLIVSAILVLLNASPLPTNNDLPETGQKAGTFGRWMNFRFRSRNQITARSHSSTPPSEHQPLVALGPLEDDDALIQFLPSDIQLQILEYISTIPFGLEESVEIASRKGLPADKAYQWAIINHDPTKDEYSIVQEWLEMEESSDKDELMEQMMQNPTLKKVLGVAPTYENVFRAVLEGNIDNFKYWIVRGFSLTSSHLSTAILYGNIEMVKYLIEDGNVYAVENHLRLAISIGDLAIFKYLFKEGKL